MKYWMIILSMAAGLGCAKPREVLKVYHYPMAAETLTGLTAEKIVRSGEACVLSSEEDVKAMRDVIASARPTTELFGEKFVRIRVDSSSSGKMALVAVIDTAGCVRGSSGPVRRLTPDQIDALLRLIGSRCQ